MFFLLRAFFWLSLIMTIIWWSGPAGSRKPGAAETLQKETAGHVKSLSALAETRFENTKTSLEQACLKRPKLCFDLLTQYNRNEAEKPQLNTFSSATPNKAKPETKHQGHAAHPAPQGRGLAE